MGYRGVLGNARFRLNLGPEIAICRSRRSLPRLLSYTEVRVTERSFEEAPRE